MGQDQDRTGFCDRGDTEPGRSEVDHGSAHTVLQLTALGYQAPKVHLEEHLYGEDAAPT